MIASSSVPHGDSEKEPWRHCNLLTLRPCHILANLSFSSPLVVYHLSFRRTVVVFVYQSRSWSLVASAFYSTVFTMSTRVVQLQFPKPNRPGHIRSTSTSSIPNNLEGFLAEAPQSPLPAFGQGDSPSLLRPDVPPNTSQTLSGMVTPTTGAFG